MTSRRLAILVAVAVVGGAVVAGVGLATQGSPKPRRVLQIDETTGRVGKVVLGETQDNVIGVLGPPSPHGGPPTPGGAVLLFGRTQIQFKNGRVVSIATDDPTAETKKAVAIGQPISAARASYRKAADCVPNSPDKTAKHPHCRIKVPSGWLLIAGDPIKTMTLSRMA
jgi:hypothetical protein